MRNPDRITKRFTLIRVKPAVPRLPLIWAADIEWRLQDEPQEWSIALRELITECVRFSQLSAPALGRARRNPAGIRAPAQCHQSFALRSVDYWITAILSTRVLGEDRSSLERTERDRPLPAARRQANGSAGQTACSRRARLALDAKSLRKEQQAGLPADAKYLTWISAVMRHIRYRFQPDQSFCATSTLTRK